LITLGVVLSEIFLFQVSVVVITCVLGYIFLSRLKKAEGEKGV
jgi:hypothetical protein